MKVAISAVQFSSQMSGVQRHAANVARCLISLPDVELVHFVIGPWQRAAVEDSNLATMPRVELHTADVKQSLVDRNLWHYQRLPDLVGRLQPDVMHLAFPVPVQSAAFACPLVVTLHDVYPYEIPGNFGFPKVLFNQLILQQCLRSVDAIACVSNTTASRLPQYTPASVWAKAIRIYNCVEPENTCATSSPVFGLSGKPFLLTVAQHRKNKNIPLLLRVLHCLLARRSVDQGMKLLVVGIRGPETQTIQRLVTTLHLEDRVVFVEGISDAELQWCYRNCEALLAPSETEGFGLPVAEALLAGCRIACSDIATFREIDPGAHCLYVPLGAGAEARFSDAIPRLLQQPLPAPLPLPQFSAGVLAGQYLALYKTLLAAPSRFRACTAAKRASPIGVAASEGP
ncbi:glycosyltransferase family 1 protein [Acidipila sp. EB88]|uniref:glycosyltransferase family 4 protein n=1 Tax=Acidipila sp. EB88 TaxID=2305226 RepID=UPI000F5E9A7B|nr:glycosyltransferase family 1 protein [Acidipila sp. EB88]RRA49623.1 glycosyltransferase family 1 protein [Acidipila sp. EB88]